MFKAPTERLQLYRRDQILSPARDLIRKNDFAQSSLGQIAKQAGLSPSIVSEYFASSRKISTVVWRSIAKPGRRNSWLGWAIQLT
jgi:AcrR family transcriptional regulator